MLNKTERKQVSEMIHDAAFAGINFCDSIYERTGEYRTELSVSETLMVSNLVSIIYRSAEMLGFDWEISQQFFLHRYTCDEGHNISDLKEMFRTAFWLVNDKD